MNDSGDMKDCEAVRESETVKDTGDVKSSEAVKNLRAVNVSVIAEDSTVRLYKSVRL